MTEIEFSIQSRLFICVQEKVAESGRGLVFTDTTAR